MNDITSNSILKPNLCLSSTPTINGKPNTLNILRKSSSEMQLLVRDQIFTKMNKNYVYQQESGTKSYWCIDCGDKFALKSSYNFHINRCSLKVIHYCQICKIFLQFSNRCMLLAHVRSHIHQMTTLNLGDVTLEPLPQDQPKLGSLCCDSDDESNFPDNLKEAVETNGKIVVHINDSTADLHSSFDKAIDRVNQMFEAALTDADEALVIQSKEIESSEPQDCESSSVTENGHVSNIQLPFGTNSISEKKINDTIQKYKPRKEKQNTNQFVSNYQQFCPVCGVTYEGVTGNLFRARTLHFQKRMIYNNVSCVCPICKLQLQNTCSLIAHKRLHGKLAPFICPECGLSFSSISLLNIHLSYTCFHFARAMGIMCFVPNCNTLSLYDNSLNTSKVHYLSNHTQITYRCVECPVSCSNMYTIQVHMSKEHSLNLNKTKVSVFYQCSLCPGQFVPKHRIHIHMVEHIKKQVITKFFFICPGCHIMVGWIVEFKRHTSKCPEYNKSLYNKEISSGFYFKSLNCSVAPKLIKKIKATKLNFIQKACKDCKNPFKYSFTTLKNLSVPEKCPACIQADNFMTPINASNLIMIEKKDIYNNSTLSNAIVKKLPLSSKTTQKISKLYDGNSSQGVNVSLDKADINVDSTIKRQTRNKIVYENQKPRKYGSTSFSTKIEKKPKIIKRKALPPTPGENSSKQKKKRKSAWSKRRTIDSISTLFNAGIVKSDIIVNNQFRCAKCAFVSESGDVFREHIIMHKEISTSYQCMECGSCFAVKQSLSTHLFILHGVSDTDEYIQKNNCFDKEAIKELEEDVRILPGYSKRPVVENQCQICYEKFENKIDFDKHFRVHGMAFLLKKQRNKVNVSPE